MSIRIFSPVRAILHISSPCGTATNGTDTIQVFPDDGTSATTSALRDPGRRRTVRSVPSAAVPLAMRAALFYAYLTAGARAAMINSDVSVELANVISAVIFYLVTAEAAFAFIRRRLGA